MTNVFDRPTVRAIYDALIAMYKGGIMKEAGYKMPTTLSRSKLRFEFNLSNSNTAMQTVFTAGVNSAVSMASSPANATELILMRNNNFHAFAMRVTLEKQVSATPGISVPRTWPDLNDFPDVAGPPAFTNAHLYLVYKGLFALTVDSKVVIPSMSLAPFLNIPIAQGKPAAANLQNYIQSQFNEEMGAQALEPLVHILGNKTNVGALTFPQITSLAWESQTAGQSHNLVLEFEGFLADNVSN
jgi:hypothetical protein